MIKRCFEYAASNAWWLGCFNLVVAGFMAFVLIGGAGFANPVNYPPPANDDVDTNCSESCPEGLACCDGECV